MFASWRRQLNWAWVACFAVLLNALAPGISQALAASGDNGAWRFAEICSVTGSKLAAAAPADAPSDEPASGSHFEHCPFCLPHAGSVGLLSSLAAPDLAPAPEPSRLAALPAGTPPGQLGAWTQAQPRAPPLAV